MTNPQIMRAPSPDSALYQARIIYNKGKAAGDDRAKIMGDIAASIKARPSWVSNPEFPSEDLIANTYYHLFARHPTK